MYSYLYCISLLRKIYPARGDAEGLVTRVALWNCGGPRAPARGPRHTESTQTTECQSQRRQRETTEYRTCAETRERNSLSIH